MIPRALNLQSGGNSSHEAAGERAASSRNLAGTIRAAGPSDAAAAADLIYLPMGRLADHLFGSGDPDRAREVLRTLFTQKENRFSYTFCDVLEAQGEVAGLLLAYPSEILDELKAPTGKQLRQVLGWAGMFRLLKRSWPFTQAKEAEPGEYYIVTLAIQPELQSGGLGGQILRHAEAKARAAGLSKCSLGVTLDNHGARRFYERFGYAVVDTVRLPRLEREIGYPGYHRMIKQLLKAES